MKAILVDGNGEILGSHSVNYQLLTSNRGWVEQNPEEWTEGFLEILQKFKEDYPEAFSLISSISFAGQMHGIVPVDQAGRPLHHAIIWSDQRNDKELQALESLYSKEKWTGKTGNVPNISFSLGKILWLKDNEPELYEKTYRFLLPKDYLRFQLTGLMSTDITDASATLMLDISKGKWAADILANFNINPDKLPEIKQSSDVDGYVMESASQLTGLRQGISVVCGCGDSQGQAIGNGLRDDRGWLCTIGTSGQIMVSIDQYRYEKDGKVHTFSYPEQGKWVLQGSTLSAGSSFKWLAENVLDDPAGIAALLDEADTVAPGSDGLIFLPYLFGERTPHMNEKAKGSFIGLTYHHKKGDMARAVVEGVLFSLYQALELIADLQDKTPEYLIATGGVFQHDVWKSAAADIFGIPVHLKSGKGGAAYGAAMLAAVGNGEFAGLSEVQAAWGISKPQQVIMPNMENHQVYKEYFNVYKDAYEHMKGIFHQLHDLSRREGTAYEA